MTVLRAIRASFSRDFWEEIEKKTIKRGTFWGQRLLECGWILSRWQNIITLFRKIQKSIKKWKKEATYMWEKNEDLQVSSRYFQSFSRYMPLYIVWRGISLGPEVTFRLFSIDILQYTLVIYRSGLRGGRTRESRIFPRIRLLRYISHLGLHSLSLSVVLSARSLYRHSILEFQFLERLRPVMRFVFLRRIGRNGRS